MRRAAALMSVLVAAACLARASAGRPDEPASPDPRFTVGARLAKDDFADGLGQWRVELEAGGTVAAAGGALDIDVPAGCTVWFSRPLDGPLMISYEATAIAAGGPNDRASDLNCFWMAADARSPGDLFASARSGRFSDYDFLRCYYAGIGGNGNTTTRFRRYVGERGNRPLLPGHDLGATEDLLAANVPQAIRLIAAGRVIGCYRDGRRLFALDDPEPYTRGWFGLRTVRSHLRVRHFRVHRLDPRTPAAPQAPGTDRTSGEARR